MVWEVYSIGLYPLHFNSFLSLQNSKEFETPEEEAPHMQGQRGLITIIEKPPVTSCSDYSQKCFSITILFGSFVDNKRTHHVSPSQLQLIATA